MFDGHCVSGNPNNNSKNLIYPNYYLHTKNNNDCKEECDKIESCQGYDYDRSSNKDNCKLYSFSGDKNGIDNTILIKRGLVDSDNKYSNTSCYVKSDFTKQGKTMEQYAYDILNKRDNNIKRLFNDMNESYKKNTEHREQNKEMILDYINKLTNKLIYHSLTDVNETNYDVVNL